MSSGTIKIVCAWCHRQMREESDRGVEGISHSICTDCLNDLRTMMVNDSSSVVKRYQERLRSKRTRESPTANQAPGTRKGSRPASNRG